MSDTEPALLRGWCSICRSTFEGVDEYLEHKKCTPVSAGHHRLLAALNYAAPLNVIDGGGEQTPERAKLRRVV